MLVESHVYYIYELLLNNDNTHDNTIFKYQYFKGSSTWIMRRNRKWMLSSCVILCKNVVLRNTKYTFCGLLFELQIRLIEHVQPQLHLRWPWKSPITTVFRVVRKRERNIIDNQTFVRDISKLITQIHLLFKCLPFEIMITQSIDNVVYTTFSTSLIQEFC